MYYSQSGGKFIPSQRELIVGPYTERVDLGLSGEQLTLRVDLKPEVLHRLLRLPMHEIINTALSGVDGFGAEIQAVNEQLAETKTHQEMLRIVETFLLRKARTAKEDLPIDKVFNLTLNFPHLYGIEQLADQACLSLRQFERQFLIRVGMGPKLFFRQARFAQAHQLKRAYPQMSWADITYRCGYFDQMHLNRDFKLFADESPASFFRSASGHHQNVGLKSFSPQPSVYEEVDD